MRLRYVRTGSATYRQTIVLRVFRRLLPTQRAINEACMFKCNQDTAVYINCNGGTPPEIWGWRNKFIVSHLSESDWALFWGYGSVIRDAILTDGDSLEWWLRLCDDSLSLDADLASTTWLESRRLLQIWCKFGLPPQNHRMAEAVFTITLTQHCQLFNTQSSQSNTEFYLILSLHQDFHIHVVTNAQIGQHERKFLGFNTRHRAVNCVAMVTSHQLKVTLVTVSSVHRVYMVWKGTFLVTSCISTEFEHTGLIDGSLCRL